MMCLPATVPDGKVNAAGVFPGRDGGYLLPARRDFALAQDRP